MVISGVLKTCKEEDYSLRACNLLTGNSIRDNFLKIFWRTQSNFKKFGYEFKLEDWLCACMRAIPVKRGFLEISRRATLRALEFLTELQNTEISPVTLLWSDSTTDAFRVNSKLSGTLWVSELDSSNCLKRTLLKTFFWEFSKTFKTFYLANPVA